MLTDYTVKTPASCGHWPNPNHKPQLQLGIQLDKIEIRFTNQLRYKLTLMRVLIQTCGIVRWNGIRAYVLCSYPKVGPFRSMTFWGSSAVSELSEVLDPNVICKPSSCRIHGAMLKAFSGYSDQRMTLIESEVRVICESVGLETLRLGRVWCTWDVHSPSDTCYAAKGVRNLDLPWYLTYHKTMRMSNSDKNDTDTYSFV